MSVVENSTNKYSSSLWLVIYNKSNYIYDNFLSCSLGSTILTFIFTVEYWSNRQTRDWFAKNDPGSYSENGLISLNDLIGTCFVKHLQLRIGGSFWLVKNEFPNKVRISIVTLLLKIL